MKINKLKTVDKIMQSNFPVGLLERLVALDERIIELEKASTDDNPSEDEQVVIVQDVLQYAGAVVAEFREVWAVYEVSEEDVQEMDLLTPTEAIAKMESDAKKSESGKVEVDGEEENDEAVSNKDD